MCWSASQRASRNLNTLSSVDTKGAKRYGYVVPVLISLWFVVDWATCTWFHLDSTWHLVNGVRNTDRVRDERGISWEWAIPIKNRHEEERIRFKIQHSSLMYIASNGKDIKLSSKAGCPIPLLLLPLEPTKMSRVCLVWIGIDVNVVVSLNCETVRWARHRDSDRLSSLPRPVVSAWTFRGGGGGGHVQDGRLDCERGGAASRSIGDWNGDVNAATIGDPRHD